MTAAAAEGGLGLTTSLSAEEKNAGYSVAGTTTLEEPSAASLVLESRELQCILANQILYGEFHSRP